MFGGQSIKSGSITSGFPVRPHMAPPTSQPPPPHPSSTAPHVSHALGVGRGDERVLGCFYFMILSKFSLTNILLVHAEVLRCVIGYEGNCK